MAVEMMFYELGKGYKRPAVGCSRLPNILSYGSGKVGTGCLLQPRHDDTYSLLDIMVTPW